MRYLTTYLIYLAVLARAVGWSQDSPPIPREVWALLYVYGASLVLEPALTRRWPSFPHLYAVLQAGLVISMLYRAPTVDFLTLLFLPLSFQMVQFFGVRVGLVWIGIFGLAMTGMLWMGLEWKPGVFMLLVNTGVNLLMARFAYLIQRTGRAQQENQRLFTELQETYRSLKGEAAQAESLAAAEERHHLVRELHDSLTQTLFSMNLAVQAAQLAAGQDPPQVEQHLRRLQTLSRSAAAEVKSLIAPSPGRVPLDAGLSTALKRLASERQIQDGLQIQLEILECTPDSLIELPERVQTNLYHIAQEALNNIAKHAVTSQAVVRLNLASHPVCLEVEDFGCGFDMKNHKLLSGSVTNQSSGFGLGEMTERAREMGWEITFDTAPGRGTRICVREKIW